MQIAYSCLGRSWNLNPGKASTVGGDMDRIRLLMRLAWDHPEHTFVLVGRNSGENFAELNALGYPDNVVNPWGWDGFRMPTLEYARVKEGPEFYAGYLGAWQKLADRLPKCGAHIMWVGQHGGSNSPLPFIDTDWDDKSFTTPQMAFVNYCGYLLDWCNKQYHIQPITICPDPRNYWKARELMAPLVHPVLAQYEMKKTTKWEQYTSWNDPVHEAGRKKVPGHREKSVYVTELDYKYAAIEMTALDHPHQIECAAEPGGITFGVVSNENRKEVSNPRLALVKEWFPKGLGATVPLFGSWCDESRLELEHNGIGPCTPIEAKDLYATLRQFRTTITFPASGSGWATAKPWECFATGAVCFFHPRYDDQGWIIPPKGRAMSNALGLPLAARKLAEDLAKVLRVESPGELATRVYQFAKDDGLWFEVSNMQRDYFELAFDHYKGGARAVEEALHL